MRLRKKLMSLERKYKERVEVEEIRRYASFLRDEEKKGRLKLKEKKEKKKGFVRTTGKYRRGFSREMPCPIPPYPAPDIDDALTNELVLEAAICERDLKRFIMSAWKIIEPETVFVPNWHIDAICDHLQAVTTREIKRLIINIPPRHCKSLTVSVFWQAWEWLSRPWERNIYASYASTLAERDNIRFSRLVNSNWYKDRWFERYNLMTDTQTKVENDRGGHRIATSVGGVATGEGGSKIIVDDPINVKDVTSDAKRHAALIWWDEVMASRLDDPKSGAKVIIMQRSHEEDLTGHVLEKENDYVHLCLPARFDGHRSRTVLHFRDPRTKEGEPLWEEKAGVKELDKLEEELGEYAFAAQYQQSPVPRGGGMFKIKHLRENLMDAYMPENIAHAIRFWDKAGTKDGGAYTCGALLLKTKDKRYIIADIVRGQWDAPKREAKIKETTKSDAERFKNEKIKYTVWLEQEPGPIWEEELVQMASGARKKLKNVKKGDFVINKYGKPTQVTGIHKQGKLDTVKITTLSGRTIYPALTHPFLVPSGWAVAKNLKAGDHLALRTRIKTNPSTNPLLEECRLAGYFIGDGCCTPIKGTGSFNAKFTCSDSLQVKDLQHCIDRLGFKMNREPSGIHFGFSQGIRGWLKKVNLAGRRTDDKRVPQWIFTANDECVAHFIGAFFACDGCVSKSRNYWIIEFYNTNKKLLKGIQSLLLRFGIYTKLKQRTYRPEFQKTRKLIYRLQMMKKDDSNAKFAERIPIFGVKGDRLKQIERIDFDKEYIPDKIVSVEFSGRKTCRCLTVGKGESFLVKDIVVHNSGGKESAESTVRSLAGYIVYAEKPTGKKEVRAEPLSCQVNAGNVSILDRTWTKECLEKLEFYPVTKYKDWGDALGGAFNKLNNPKRAGTWGKK